MTANAPVYFFCDHVYDLVLFRGFAARIRARRPHARLIAILDASPNLRRYDIERMLQPFDEVRHVGFCSYGGLRAFAAALAFRRDLTRIPFEPGGVVFLSSGRFLVSQILLRRVRRAGVTTVWITARDNKVLEDVVYDIAASAVYNIYNSVFGASFVDVYLTRGGDRLRSIQHRVDPYSFAYFLKDHESPLAADEMYYPAMPAAPEPGAAPIVVVCGSMFTGRPWIDRDAFLALWNRCLDVIRERHAGARLLYLPHPRETDENQAGLRLEGFDVNRSVNAEFVFATEAPIAAVYSPWSTSVQSAEYYGIRGYWFYRLFAGRGLDPTYATHLDGRYASMPPHKFIEDFDRWMAGAYDYEPRPAQAQSLEAVDRMLDRVFERAGQTLG